MNPYSPLLALVVAATPLVAGCEKPSQARQGPSPTTQPSLSAASATPAELPPSPSEIAGDLKPIESANLAFKVGGRLASLRVKRGEPVKRGQILAALSDAEARAALAQAQAAVKAAQAQAALAEDADRRAAQLGDAGAIPSGAVVSSNLAVDAARAGVAQALAALSLAQVNVANHVLTAPFDGTIVNVPEGVGSTVGPGMPIMRIERLDVLVLQATAAEADAARLTVGMSIPVRTTNGVEAVGNVRAVLGSLEPVSRRAPIEIEIPNKQGRLIAGAYVRAMLPPLPPGASSKGENRSAP